MRQSLPGKRGSGKKDFDETEYAQELEAVGFHGIAARTQTIAQN